MKPGLFILGGPKCGTTAMCSYLADHPSICFAVPKEPKYFHTDFTNAHREALTEGKYMRCFDVDPATHRILAEGTVWYLYSDVAVANILAFNPDALFVVMIRNPVDLVYSLHSQLYYGGDEDVENFETAWRLQAARKLGKKLPVGVRDPKSLFYGDIARLGEQIERLFCLADRERVLVIKYDDFAADAAREYARVIAFADLAPDTRQRFERHNENRALRKNAVTTAMLLIKRLKTALGIKKSFGVWQMLQPLVAQTRKREEMPETLYDELQDYFRADIQKLEAILDLDLSTWKQPKR